MQSRQEDTTLFVHGAKEQGRERERERGRERESEHEGCSCELISF